MLPYDPFYIQLGSIYAIPIIHYNMEMASQVKAAFEVIKPDCVAVELPETMQSEMIHAATRLPDISVVVAHDKESDPLYYFCEPCDPSFEALRSASENQIPAYCIDVDIDSYPDRRDLTPDSYSIYRLGLKNYYDLYIKTTQNQPIYLHPLDILRETYMARRLKELSLSYDKVLFVCGIAHIKSIMKLMDNSSFPDPIHAKRESIQVCTITESSCREVMAEWPYLTIQYEENRHNILKNRLVYRQKIIFQLYKEAAEKYKINTGNPFPNYHLKNIMKFVRNYSLIAGQLMPDLYKILSAAKGCVDHNYAYETWDIATTYPYLRNIDSLPALNLSIKDLWGNSKILRFHMREKGRKNSLSFKQRKDRSNIQFKQPSPFTICSYPPEDIAIENFGKFLKKKSNQILTDEASHSIPFSTSLEEGIDTKETIRHWHEHKLYVKVKRKPPESVGSICVIFDEDSAEDKILYEEKYPWRTTWLGEHQQESDMAFYATPITRKIIGPGISQCEYGGFMMSYPPRRMMNVWFDSDYSECRNKSEVLLMSAIDYAVKPVIVYVANKPPRSHLKSFAKRFGKKVVYIPIMQLSPTTLNRLRIFHVLDGHDKRKIADEYIF